MIKRFIDKETGVVHGAVGLSSAFVYSEGSWAQVKSSYVAVACTYEDDPKKYWVAVTDTKPITCFDCIAKGAK